MNKLGIIRTQPQIAHIINLVNAILQHCDFIKDGQICNPDQIRLKNVSEWVEPRKGTLHNNIGSFMTKCNCSCDFCYIKGNPPSLALDDKDNITQFEVDERIDLWDQGYMAFEYVREYGEPFCNPHALDIIKKIRKHAPSEIISLSTNGTKLNHDILMELQELKPLYLFVSVNTLNPSIRLKVMKDKLANVLADNLRFLKEMGFTWFGGIVASPTIPLDDLRETIFYIDRMGAQVIRIGLPGVTKWHPLCQSANDIDCLNRHWNKVVDLVRELRNKIDTPIYCQPYLYESDDIIPTISGVVKNSPAYDAGIRYGDVISEINGIHVESREACIKVLKYSGDTQRITINRDGKSLEFILTEVENNPLLNRYPYKPVGYISNQNCGIVRKFGICLDDDISFNTVNEIKKVAENNPGKNIAFVTSSLKKPYAEKLLEKFDVRNVRLEIVKPNFMGGNIMVGDLLTVVDIINHFKKTEVKYDLILLPSSMFTNGFDLVGESFFDISKALKVDVQLILCNRIMT